MKTFIYTISVQGKTVERRVKALSQIQAQSYLKRKNIIPITIKEETAGLFSGLFQKKGISQDEVVSFAQLFSGCIQTGLTIKDSLTILEKQTQNKEFKAVISDIINKISVGSTLSDAFATHTDVFPMYFPFAIKAGEASGNLGEVLDYISNYLDKVNELRKQLKSILTYPIVVSVMGILLLMVIFFFVAPTFKEIFSKTNKPLPLPTTILFSVSDFLQQYFPIVAICIFIIVGICMAIYKTKEGRMKFDTFIIQAPLVGNMVRDILMMRFISTFEILINNGVPMLQTLQVLEESTTNLALKEVVTNMRMDVSKGLSFSGPMLRKKEFFSPMILHTIAGAEKSGTLGESLKRIATFSNKEIIYSIKAFASKVDPIVTSILGIIILFVASSVYLPIFSMMEGL